MVELRPPDLIKPETRGSATREPPDQKSNTQSLQHADEMNDVAAGMLLAAPLSNGVLSAFGSNVPTLKTMAVLHRRLHDDATSSANAWVGFLHRRLTETIDLAGRIASCRSPADVCRVNVEYLQNATDEYLAQVERTVVDSRRSTMAVLASMAATQREIARSESHDRTDSGRKRTP